MPCYVITYLSDNGLHSSPITLSSLYALRYKKRKRKSGRRKEELLKNYKTLIEGFLYPAPLYRKILFCPYHTKLFSYSAEYENSFSGRGVGKIFL